MIYPKASKAETVTRLMRKPGIKNYFNVPVINVSNQNITNKKNTVLAT